MFRRIINGLRSSPQRDSNSARELIPSQGHTVLYTRGDELLTPNQYRSSFDQVITRALGGQARIDDYTLGRALGVSAIAYAATEYDANTTSALPLVIRDPSGETLDGTPMDYVVSRWPQLCANIIRSLDLWGRAYLWKRPNPYGWKTGLEWINPQRIRELPTVHMQILGYEIRDAWGYLISACEPPENVIVIQAFDSDPTGVGLSKFEVAWRWLGIDFGIATHAAAFFTNSARIDGMLTFDRELDVELLKDARKQWEKFRGATNAHQTAVMPGGAKWTPVQAVPKDLAMKELVDVDVEHTVTIWGMHRALLGLGDVADPLSANSTFSGHEINFIRNTALPRVENVVLAALNEHWAWVDFNRPNYYTLAIDEAAIPQLAEAQLTKSTTAISLTAAGLTDINEGRKVIGFQERAEGEFLKNDPTLPKIVLESGGITLAQYRQMVLGTGGDDLNADVLIIGGQVLPASRLMEIANANAQRLITAPPPAPTTPPLIDVPPDPPPQLPGGQPPAQSAEPVRGGVSVCVALDLANHPDLVSLQRRTQQLYGDQQVEWNSPDEFHCTLLVAPMVEETQAADLAMALRDVQLPELSLRIGSLKSFDNVGDHALHFRVRQNAALRDLQEQIYELAAAQGMDVSAFSLPDDYIPHITMGYLKVKPSPVVYQSNLAVKPRGLIAWQDEDTVLFDSSDPDIGWMPIQPGQQLVLSGDDLQLERKPVSSSPSRTQCMNCDAPPTKDVLWAEGMGRAWFCDKHFAEWSAEHQGDIDSVHDISDGEVPQDFSGRTLPPKRNLAPMQVVIDLSENQFVKYARRSLSEALTTQNVLDAQWIAPVDWRLVLCEVEEWTPNQVATFIRNSNFAETKRIDIPTNGWHIEGNTIYLWTFANEDLDALHQSVLLDLEAADLYPNGDQPSGNWIPGIAVATLTDASLVKLDALPTAEYPLVGANITTITGDNVQHQWPLRGASAAQLKELQSWRSMVRRKGRGYEFNVESLPPHVELYIRLALEDGDDEAALFEMARSILIRSYSATRDGYVQAVTDILIQALSDEGRRRTLGADMRKTARLFGLQAASDALTDAGLNVESLSSDDVTLFQAWLAETSGYITGLGDEIFNEQGLTAAMIPGRAQMWADKSLDDLYYAILRQNAPTKTGTWRVNPANEHCHDEGSTAGCAEREGQAKTLDEWGQIGFPRDRRLTCGGWKCGCSLEDENGNVLRSR